MGVSEWLFSFQGRMGRIGFLGAIPIVVANYWAIGYVWRLSIGSKEDYVVYGGLSTAIVLVIIVLWMSFAIATKRAHDRGYSGLVNFTPLAVMAICIFLAGVLSGGNFDLVWHEFDQYERGVVSDNTDIRLIIQMGWIAVYATNFWLLVDLWFWPGQPFDNRFGPARFAPPMLTDEAKAQIERQLL